MVLVVIIKNCSKKMSGSWQSDDDKILKVGKEFLFALGLSKHLHCMSPVEWANITHVHANPLIYTLQKAAQ